MPVVKLRGLPWSCTVEDIVKFLEPIKIVIKKQEIDDDSIDGSNSAMLSVYLTANTEGRPSGEAFIEVENESDVDLALVKNNNLMGQRYIEVFKSSYDQLSKHIEESLNRTLNWSDPVVRLRGLPYGCTEIDIRNFFNGLNIGYDGIMTVIDFSGRFNGEAFVQFESLQDAAKALERHKEKMSNRYIEVFRSTSDEMQYYSSTNKDKPNSMKSKKNYTNDRNKSKVKQMKSPFNNDHGRVNRSFSRNNQRMNPYARNISNDNHHKNMNPRFNPIRNANTPPYQNDNYFNHDNNDNMQSLMNLNTNNHRNHSFERNNFNNNNNNEQFSNNHNVRRAKGYRSRSPSPFQSYQNDLNQFQSSYQPPPTHNFRSSRTPYTIKMRGLPFACTEDDIKQFFAPNEPLNIIFSTGKDLRRNGEAEIDFISHNDACEAMKCDKKFIGNRYIELFLLSGSMASQQPSLLANQQHPFGNNSKRFQQHVPQPQQNQPQNISYNLFSNDNSSNNKYNNGNNFNRRSNKQQQSFNSNFRNKNSQFNQNSNNFNNHNRGYSNTSPSSLNKLPIVSQQQQIPPPIHNHHQQQQQHVMPTLMHQANHGPNQTFDEIMMADMAKKAFEVAFNQYQQQQQQHQPNHLQPPPLQHQSDHHHHHHQNKYNNLPIKSNFNPPHPSNRRF